MSATARFRVAKGLRVWECRFGRFLQGFAGCVWGSMKKRARMQVPLRLLQGFGPQALNQDRQVTAKANPKP